jgi:hypothetical protein
VLFIDQHGFAMQIVIGDMQALQHLLLFGRRVKGPGLARVD